MANYSNLLATIAANIYTNHNNEVTAAMVKTAVDQMVASLGDGYQFAGVATPATNPGTPDERVFYIASKPGTYTNFGGLVLNDGEVAVLYGSGSVWSKEVILNIDAVPTAGSNNLVESGGAYQALLNKVDVSLGSNLINPKTITTQVAFNWSGTITNVGPGYSISDYIPVNGQDIIADAFGSTYSWAYGVVYDADYNKLRILTSGQYTYQAGDAYVRFAFAGGSRRANYGTTLLDYVPYTQTKEIDDEFDLIDDRITSIEAEIGLTTVNVPYYPNALYTVWNDLRVNRQYIVRMGLSRLLAIGNYGDAVNFKSNKLHYLPLFQSQISEKTETNLSYTITDKTKVVKFRSALASDGENVKPRILVIGDSVTDGYGADTNKEPGNLPNQYWAFAKLFFEMDKIDNGDSGHDVLFTGIKDGSFSIDYRSISRSVSAKAVARGGAKLSDLFQPYWGAGGTESNPFYDSVNQTFSINAYLAAYRTMDDAGVRLVSASADPHGESVTGSDGLTYTIGSLIDTQEKLHDYNVCTPTHIFVNLNHNTSSNFLADVTNVVNIVKTELPTAIFAWLSIDSTGTSFPQDFPNFDPNSINLNFLHTQNNNHYIDFRDNLEDEANGIYLLGLNFIQPEAIDLPFVTEKINELGPEFNVADRNVSGMRYHPNNICHCDWGYELYAFIKWLIS